MEQTSSSRILEMMAENSRPATVVAVTSGKGGVGKTNIAANLAVCLASSGQDVTLFDADMGLGNVDVLMKVDSRFNISDVLAGRKTLREIICIGPAGVKIISAGSGLSNIADMSRFELNRLTLELAELQSDSDVIIIDTGAGIMRSVVAFCLAADHTLVVTTPEPTAITDAYAMIKVLAGEHYTGRISLVVNMASSISEGKRVFRQIYEVAARFLNIFIYEGGILCRDERLTASVRKRQPVVLCYPRSEAACSLNALATRLDVGRFYNTATAGFFRKVVNWFF